jgi:Uma2 family endonuclease
MRWTRKHLERLPDDGNRYEVVRGELFVTPAPSTMHEELLRVLSIRLRDYVEPRGLGLVYAGRTAVAFEDSEVQPDIVVRARVKPLPRKWEDMPIPLLVVEILSPETRRRDLGAKRDLYMNAGVAEYWIVDAISRTIRVIRADGEREVNEHHEWVPSGADAPLLLDVRVLFREALD